MNIAIIRMTFAIALVLVLTATGLWAGGADEEEPAAAADKKYVTDPTTGKVVSAPEYGGTLTFALKAEWPGPDSLLSGGWGRMYPPGSLQRSWPSRTGE